MSIRTWFLTAVLLVAAPVVSSALLDTHSDSFGVYFDSEASSTCRTVAPLVPFDVYLIVANPTMMIDGFECTVGHAGLPASNFIVLEIDLGAGAVDNDPSPDGFAVTSLSPYPVSGNCAVLCRLRMIVLSTGSLDFLVGPGTAPTLPYDFPVLFAQGVPRPARTLTCVSEIPVACVNGWCPTITTYPCYRDPWNDLSLDVSVFGPGRSDAAIVATNWEATDGFDDGLDVPRAAPTGPGYLAVSIEHPDWPGGPRFSTDRRAQFVYGDEYRVWPLLVETDLAGYIRIAATGGNPYSTNYLLRDMQTGLVTEFFPHGGDYLLFVGDGTPTVRRYELICGLTNSTTPVAPEASQGALLQLSAHPNPFNPSTTLSFELPVSARAEIRVLSLRGEVVVVLGGDTYAAGRHEEQWQGRDRAGRTVPSGTYLAQLYVDGVPAGTAARLSLLR